MLQNNNKKRHDVAINCSICFLGLTCMRMLNIFVTTQIIYKIICCYNGEILHL